MLTVSEFHRWYEERKPGFDLESKIRDEKLAAGVNGVEWLVMQTLVTDDKKESLEQWLRFLPMYKQLNAEQVMKDAIKMDADSFYEKYEFNWWISIDETLTYLSLLKERNYDHYFNFIQSLE